MNGFHNDNYINHIVWQFHYLDGYLIFPLIFLYSTFVLILFFQLLGSFYLIIR